MECFNSLLHKLRELHEREVEGWQLKIQELSNKKGCDTKRMEELFSKNQQMKEQQRMLTENIKTLENRLRAGLCDRCTVTQEVARKKQQELEATQMQSIQHITLLMTEVTNVKKENKRLREEIRNSRAALEAHSDHSSNNSTTTAEVKSTSPPDRSSPEVIAVALATSRFSKQPADGDIVVRTESEQRAEEAEHRQCRGMNRIHLESNKPFSSKFLKTEHSVTRVGERRVQLESRLDPLSSIIPQALLLRNSQLSLGGEVNPNRHVIHAPVPCRPQPVKCPVTLPWALSESSNWTTVSSPGASQARPLSPKLKHARFPNPVPTGHHANSKRQVWGSPWQKHSPPSHSTKEPTMLFSLRGLTEKTESQIKPQEIKEIQPPKAERVSEDEVIEVHDGPLDLSDRGKSSLSQMARDYSPLNLQSVESFSDKDARTKQPRSLSSTSPVSPRSSSSLSPVKQHEVEPQSDHNHKQVKDNEQKEEVNGKTDQSNEKKVPVLTISLRPVVVLESLKSALKKQEIKSNCKSAPSETGSSSEEPQEEDEKGSLSGQESNQGCKRKRASVDTETDRDSDADIV